jgi:hypothetical protein
MHYHITTSFAGFDQDPAFITTVQRLFTPGERPKEERPACLTPTPLTARPEPHARGPLDHLLGKSVSTFDGEADELEALAADPSIRIGPDVFLTEPEARDLAKGKLPSRLLEERRA